MSKMISALYSFAAVAVAAFISSYFVQTGMALFYANLQMPPLTPPDGAFPIVWSVLYLLMIVSFYRILQNADIMRVQTATLLFLGQLVLQILWCFLFFYQAYFLYALIVILLLLWTVWRMIGEFKIIDPAAGNLQYPYLLWLLLATYLNAGVVWLNGNQLNM